MEIEILATILHANANEIWCNVNEVNYSSIFNSRIVFRKAGSKRIVIKTCWNFVPPILRVSTFEIDFIYRIGLPGYKKSMSIVRSIVLLPVTGADFSAGVPRQIVFFFFSGKSMDHSYTSPVSKLLHRDFSFLLFFTIRGVLILILLIFFFFRYRRKIIHWIHRHENRSKK